MFANPFDNARAKIKRARKHYSELVAIDAAYGKDQALSLTLSKSPEGNTVGIAEVAAPPPIDAAPIIADIVGNFRSSLDIAVSQACRLRGETDANKLKKTYFAFAGSERDWEDNVRNRMAGADAAIRTAVKRCKPWKEGGNRALYALSKIAADDKHVTLVPIAVRGTKIIIDGFTARHPDGELSRVQINHERWLTPTKMELFTVFYPAEVEITGPTIMQPMIGFGDVYDLRGYAVVPALHQMGTMCEDIINLIEKAARS